MAFKNTIGAGRTVPPVKIEQAKNTEREKAPSERKQKVASTRTKRAEAEKKTGFTIDSPKPNTDRKPTRTSSSKQSSKLVRQRSEASIGTIEKPKNNKKEKPSPAVGATGSGPEKKKTEKTSTFVFWKKKEKEKAPAALPPPPVLLKEDGSMDADKFGHCMLRIVKEKQFEPLKEKLAQHFKKVYVTEVYSFLDTLSKYSAENPPDIVQAQDIFDRYLDPNTDSMEQLNLTQPVVERARKALLDEDVNEFFATLMGEFDDAATDDVVAVLPQLIQATGRHYRSFIESLTPAT